MILLIANWKMAPEKSIQAVGLAKKINTIAKTYKKQLSVIVCPPYLHIPMLTKQIKTVVVLTRSKLKGTSQHSSLSRPLEDDLEHSFN